MLLVLRLLLLGQAASREECLLALLPRDTIRHIFGFALLATLPRHAVFSPHAPWRNVLATHPQLPPPPPPQLPPGRIWERPGDSFTTDDLPQFSWQSRPPPIRVSASWP